MGMAVGGKDSDYNTNINVIPLVDVLLVLLILFIITLPVMTHAVKIDLPRASDAPPPPEASEPVTIEVQFDGIVLWNGVPASRQQLRSYVADAAKQTPQPEVHIMVARQARYEAATDVLFAVQRGGLQKIGFVTDARGGL
jgi:biopolymer transport protein ExbD